MHCEKVLQIESNEHIAEVVGHQHCKILRLERNTQTKIIVPKPEDPPFMKIFGNDMASVENAAKMIIDAVAHFDAVRERKRNVSRSLCGTTLTLRLDSTSKDVSSVIGSKGSFIQTVASMLDVKIISPTRNKLPIFSVSGKLDSVREAILVMKLKILISGSGKINVSPGECIAVNKYVSQKRHNVSHPLNIKQLRSCFETEGFKVDENHFPLVAYNGQERCSNHLQERKIIVVLHPCQHFHNCDLCFIAEFRIKRSMYCEVCKQIVEQFEILDDY